MNNLKNQIIEIIKQIKYYNEQKDQQLTIINNELNKIKKYQLLIRTYENDLIIKNAILSKLNLIINDHQTIDKNLIEKIKTDEITLKKFINENIPINKNLPEENKLHTKLLEISMKNHFIDNFFIYYKAAISILNKNDPTIPNLNEHLHKNEKQEKILREFISTEKSADDHQ